MNYQIELYDTWGRKIAVYDRVPLIEAVRTVPNKPDRIAGMLPQGVTDLGHVYKLRVLVDGEPFCEAEVTRIEPQWSDTRKLILDRYLAFHEVVEVDAERDPEPINAEVFDAYENRSIDTIAKRMINAASGPAHYWVGHDEYPDGAEREYQKFLARKTPENELEVGGIESGQWVGPDRINTDDAYAKDGDTIAGLVVDGEEWPDVRLMMIDCEETSRNAHAVKRHPEVAGWTDEQYAAGGYKLSADAATDALQNLLDTKGLDYIELNPHKNTAGEYDNRVDAYGRYIGLVFGGGECFNAALVELGHSEVYLYENGDYLVPEMALKEFYSYAGQHRESVEETARTLVRLDAGSGLFESLTALAYAAGGYGWSMGYDYGIGFRKADPPDHVLFFDPVTMGVTLGSDSTGIANVLYFEGNPLAGSLNKTYSRAAGVAEFGERADSLRYYSLALEEDADKLAEGILDDLAYPAPCGAVVFFHGDNGISVGDVVELRNAPLRRLEREVDGEWGGVFTGKLVGRVKQVTHRFSGKYVQTRILLTSPLRSVENPLAYIVRGQPSERLLYQFRLDDATVGLDMGYHLD